MKTVVMTEDNEPQCWLVTLREWSGNAEKVMADTWEIEDDWLWFVLDGQNVFAVREGDVVSVRLLEAE